MVLMLTETSPGSAGNPDVAAHVGWGVHAAASSKARTPHPTCAATSGFPALPGEVSVNMSTMRVYLVGGAVRDRLLGLPVRERDWVVVGAQPQELESAGYLPVGREFPVYLHPQTHEEYAL